MSSTKLSAVLPVLSTLGLASLVFIAPTSYAEQKPLPILDNNQFNVCLDNLSQSSAFASVKDTLAQYRPAQGDPSVLESLDYQPEFQKEPWDYLASLVDEERVIDGIAASERYADVLARIEAQYGVNRYDVLGVWGVESDFGTTLGKKEVVQSLATLSCFGRRQSYFRSEYVSALKILKQGDIAPNDFKGSWAGAFGQTQFMPSTFLQLAQDFDGDGRKDLVNSQADALASTANFLKNSGYQSGQPWGYEVRLPANINASNDRKNKQPISHWRNLGITLVDGSELPDSLSNAGLLLPAGKNGPAFLVGRNFDAFYAYNASENYALAIAHLSDRIEQQNTDVDFATPWPTDDPGLSRKQSRELQQALNLLGYDIGEVDGIIGDGTRRAIQQYQTDNGLTPDGRAGKKIHQHLMHVTANMPQHESEPADEAQHTADDDQLATGNAHSASKKISETKSGLSKLLQIKSLTAILIGLFIVLVIALVSRRKR
ncbi:lytic murein transglycosylase [Psychrobacter sanguinis]|uniref:Lytic murein transglycosylase n=1 Tax=Psychrobacter sanguinis TaxID=861445 RepID=A0A844M2Z4_9GAMM|nr:lytic murein transglycosylase [Psychrobacter sanguinis]MUG32897.1 lytic murein transglycosylase [Psychrobacter sanguinis]